MSESRPETLLDRVRRIVRRFTPRPPLVTIDHVVEEEIAAILGGDLKEGPESEDGRLLGDGAELPTQHNVPAELERWLDAPRLNPPRRGVSREDVPAHERRSVHRLPGGGAGMVDPGASVRLHALCLSGGGIRSAAFCLGVVQALAKARLLSRFHYLSTVSGGGYTGALIWRLMRTLLQVDPTATVTTAEGELNAPRDRNFNWLRGIREYTSYLAPNAGLTSLDVWAAVALYLRNLLVNFCIFLPGLIGLALLARLYLRLVEYAPSASWQDHALLATALACLFWANVRACLWVPVHVDPEARSKDFAPRIVGQISAPAVLGWAFLGGAWVLWNRWAGDQWMLPLLAGGTLIAGYVVAWLLSSRRADLFRSRNAIGWLVATGVDVIVLWLGVRAAQSIGSVVALTILAPAWVIAAHLLHAAVSAVLRKETRESWLDREWIGRLSATEILPAVGWMLFGFVCLALPHLLQVHVLGEGRHKTLAAISALLSGPIAALLGRSASTAAGSTLVQATLRRILPTLAAGLASAIFMIALLVLASAEGWRLVAWLTPGNACAYGDLMWDDGCSPAILWLLAGVVLLFGASLLLGWLLNVNRFSLHEMYRNRLARAFLGAATYPRDDDGFTRFAEEDRIALRNVAMPHAYGGCRLFPVINTAMNLTSGTRTAWAERKAASFTMTPLHCGSAALGDDDKGRFVQTPIYGGARFAPGDGVALDTAMTISGAAVSPNAGYHSSPTTSFIMTLFNARLGAWMPNPARASLRSMQNSQPPNGFWALIAEMIGKTNDQRNTVYLSDGGHFENLGLYEVLRRRCAVIFVVDADCDPTYQYFDLGNAIRKARIDLGVEIEFFRREHPVAGFAPFTSLLRAEIRYPPTGMLQASTGVLLYLKARKAAGMPADVAAYAAANSDFPHESTGNQFFTESQFESYRRLGEYLAS